MTSLLRSSFLKSSTILTRSSSEPVFSPLQNQVNALVGDFTEQATDPKTLSAMMGAGMAYRFARVGTLAAASSLLPEGNALASFFVRGTSYAVGLAGESATFNGINHGFLLFEGHEPTQSFGKEFLNSAFSLGSLKFFGKLGEGQNPLLQHLLADTGMVASHQLAALAQLEEKPEGDAFSQLLQAEAMNWQMKTGMGLIHGLAPLLAAAEKTMDLFLDSREKGLAAENQSTFLYPFSMALEEGSATNSKASGEHSLQAEELISNMSSTREGGNKKKLIGLLVEFIKKMGHDPNKDKLTGLLSPFGFRNFFSVNPGYALVINIDHFKAYNLKYRWPEGDKVLKRIAEILKETVGKNGIGARWDGDGFILVLPQANHERAQETAEKIRREVEKQIFQIEEKDVEQGVYNIKGDDFTASVTVSIGIAKIASSLEDTLRRSEDSLWKAKNSGRNRVVGEEESLPSILAIGPFAWEPMAEGDDGRVYSLWPSDWAMPDDVGEADDAQGLHARVVKLEPSTKGTDSLDLHLEAYEKSFFQPELPEFFLLPWARTSPLEGKKILFTLPREEVRKFGVSGINLPKENDHIILIPR